jgi:hypothetical protein
MDATAKEVKCETALNAIAPRYRAAIRGSYRTDCGTAFPPVMDPAFDGRAPDWRAFTSIRRRHPMTKLSKTLIAATAFGAIATSAFSEAAWDFKAGMAYMYGGPGKMSAMAMASTEKNHEAMMKHAKKVPDNTVFFMDQGSLYMCPAGSIRAAISS